MDRYRIIETDKYLDINQLTKDLSKDIQAMIHGIIDYENMLDQKVSESTLRSMVLSNADALDIGDYFFPILRVDQLDSNELDAPNQSLEKRYKKTICRYYESLIHYLTQETKCLLDRYFTLN